MNAIGMLHLKPTEALLLSGAFRIVRQGAPISLEEVTKALEAANRARFGGLLSIERIDRLGCAEVRAGTRFVREFWVEDGQTSYFPHRGDAALATWLLHQLGHRIAAEVGARIAFADETEEPRFHLDYPTPAQFIDRAPECAGLLHAPARWAARRELRACLSALPHAVRAWLEHADMIWPDEPHRRGLILP